MMGGGMGGMMGGGMMGGGGMGGMDTGELEKLMNENEVNGNP